MPTHEVTNVAPPWRDVDVFTADQALTEQLAGDSADPATLKAPNLKELGTLVGSDQVQEWARRPTPSRPFCIPTTGTATASTRSSSTRPGTP